jgi:hypothetical protein
VASLHAPYQRIRFFLTRSTTPLEKVVRSSSVVCSIAVREELGKNYCFYNWELSVMVVMAEQFIFDIRVFFALHLTKIKEKLLLSDMRIQSVKTAVWVSE